MERAHKTRRDAGVFAQAGAVFLDNAVQRRLKLGSRAGLGQAYYAFLRLDRIMHAYGTQLLVGVHAVYRARLGVPAMHAHVGVLVSLAKRMTAVGWADSYARRRTRRVGKRLHKAGKQRALLTFAAEKHYRPALLVQTC